eukprot:XP_001707440.1 Hypothetical protein GL50803_31468 [Giardia lamblia ATCC 50803]
MGPSEDTLLGFPVEEPVGDRSHLNLFRPLCATLRPRDDTPVQACAENVARPENRNKGDPLHVTALLKQCPDVLPVGQGKYTDTVISRSAGNKPWIGTIVVLLPVKVEEGPMTLVVTPAFQNVGEEGVLRHVNADSLKAPTHFLLLSITLLYASDLLLPSRNGHEDNHSEKQNLRPFVLL